MFKSCFACLLVLLSSQPLLATQDSTSVKTDTIAKGPTMNDKMEALFKIIPVPLYSYSTEAGHTFGLAKYNLINLSKLDTISKPSRISELVSFSTLGRINVALSTDLNWHQGKYMVLGFFNYNQRPEYILGIGNDVTLEGLEQISVTRFKLVNYGLIQVFKDLYIGPGIDLSYYAQIKTDSASFLIENNISGVDGGTSTGIGFAIAYDNRVNRYNPRGGFYMDIKTMFFPSFLGNPYLYSRLTFDVRKYFNPWYKHVIALQVTTSFRSGDVPFYDLSLMGGAYKMRGYYEGAIRDKAMIDGQVEYRMPVLKRLGITGWVGTGRVGKSVSDLSLDGLWLSYGAGIRFRVDTPRDTNLRFDFGFGPGGIKGTYINFAEAF
jgi:hypothetical protein